MKLPINVVGLIPATCENMPAAGHQARRHRHQHVRPDHRDPQHRRRRPPDPVRRAHLRRALRARRVIDIATLTGACIIALGAPQRPVLANDDELAAELRPRPRRRPRWRCRCGTSTRSSSRAISPTWPTSAAARRHHHRRLLPGALHQGLQMGAPRHRRHGLEDPVPTRARPAARCRCSRAS
jgi:hypothetical protein